MRFTSKATTTVIGTTILLLLFTLISITQVNAQLSVTGLGTVTLGTSGACNPSYGWLSGMTCQTATVNCLSGPPYNVQPIGVTYGYATPPAPILPKGTIVIISGDGGTTRQGPLAWTPSTRATI